MCYCADCALSGALKVFPSSLLTSCEKLGPTFVSWTSNHRSPPQRHRRMLRWMMHHLLFHLWSTLPSKLP